MKEATKQSHTWRQRNVVGKEIWYKGCCWLYKGKNSLRVKQWTKESPWREFNVGVRLSDQQVRKIISAGLFWMLCTREGSYVYHVSDDKSRYKCFIEKGKESCFQSVIMGKVSIDASHRVQGKRWWWSSWMKGRMVGFLSPKKERSGRRNIEAWFGLSLAWTEVGSFTEIY